MRITHLARWGLAGLLLALVGIGPWVSLEAQARSAATPWTSEIGPQNLVYGATTTADVQQFLGAPDRIVRQEQMHPVIENYYYFAEGGTGAASVLVFESNLLVGLLYKSPSNQFVDLTYFLADNGDRSLNAPIRGDIQGYYPNLPLYWW